MSSRSKAKLHAKQNVQRRGFIRTTCNDCLSKASQEVKVLIFSLPVECIECDFSQVGSGSEESAGQLVGEPAGILLFPPTTGCALHWNICAPGGGGQSGKCKSISTWAQTANYTWHRAGCAGEVTLSDKDTQALAGPWEVPLPLVIRVPANVNNNGITRTDVLVRATYFFPPAQWIAVHVS